MICIPIVRHFATAYWIDSSLTLKLLTIMFCKDGYIASPNECAVYSAASVSRMSLSCVRLSAHLSKNACPNFCGILYICQLCSWVHFWQECSMLSKNSVFSWMTCSHTLSDGWCWQYRRSADADLSITHRGQSLLSTIVSFCVSSWMLWEGFAIWIISDTHWQRWRTVEVETCCAGASELLSVALGEGENTENVFLHSALKALDSPKNIVA